MWKVFPRERKSPMKCGIHSTWSLFVRYFFIQRTHSSHGDGLSFGTHVADLNTTWNTLPVEKTKERKKRKKNNPQKSTEIGGSARLLDTHPVCQTSTTGVEAEDRYMGVRTTLWPECFTLSPAPCSHQGLGGWEDGRPWQLGQRLSGGTRQLMCRFLKATWIMTYRSINLPCGGKL